MIYLFALVLGLAAGAIGAFIVIHFTKTIEKIPAAHVVKKIGPALYGIEKKKKPKSKSDLDIWNKENGQQI